MKVFLGGKSTKTEIVSQAQKDYATQRAAINFRQQKQQEMENKLHSEMINKIKKEEAVERAKLQKKKNWATECYSDNRYVEFQSLPLARDKESIINKKGEIGEPGQRARRAKVWYPKLQENIPLITNSTLTSLIIKF